MRRIKITYQIVTPESAELGECDDSGWENEEGVCVDPDDWDIEEYGSTHSAVIGLALKIIGNGVEGSDYPNCYPGHTWYTESDGDMDYTDGSVKTLSYHLEGFTKQEEIDIYAQLRG